MADIDIAFELGYSQEEIEDLADADELLQEGTLDRYFKEKNFCLDCRKAFILDSNERRIKNLNHISPCV